MTHARLLLCLSIVAAFEVGLAAQSPVSEDIAVPGGTAAFAAALGIDPVPDRARFVGEVTRILYDVPVGRNAIADARLERLKTFTAPDAAATGGGEVVPVPLTASIWSRAVFHRTISAGALFTAIVGDRQASLICHALAGADDETLRFVADHPAVLTRLYDRGATAFAGFSGNLHVRNGRILPPGGPDAVPLWESVVGERVDRPERFIRELFERYEGRLAYLYDTIGEVEPSRQSFALGLWIADAAVRLARFKALADATAAAYSDWHVRMFPFSRPLSDLAMLLGRVRTDGDGRPLLPSRALWAHVFGEPLPQDERDKPAVADAAWLAAVVLTKDLQVRSDRLDQYAFGQRVFGSADERDADSAEAIRAFPRTRMLMLSLERIGVTASDTYAAAARNAARLSSMEGRRGFMAVAQFQGALALVVRMARVQSLDAEDAGWLVDDLVAREPNRDDQYGSAIADWLTQSLLPMLPHARNAEMAVLLGLAGRTEIAPTPVAWEGQQYRLDLSASELRRLRHIRERQGGYSLDEAVELDRIRRVVEDPTSSGDHIREAIEKIRLLAEDLEPAGKTDPGTLAPGVDPPRSARRLVDRILKDLSKPDAVNDRSRVKEAAEAVSELTDAVLAQALLSITYAIDLGDADGSVLLVGDVAIRHDFGFGMRDATVRARVQWGVPKVDVVPGQPWRVKGSLLGLDVGLSSLALRRITADLVSGAPTLTSNERESFAVSLALLNPYGLRDVDRDGIAAAVRRGRARILALDASGLDDVIDGIRMDGWRARAVRWMFAHRTGRDEILSLFSLSELLYLSSDSTPGEDDWGMSAIATVGCVCTRLKPTGRWTMWTGRPQAGVMSALVADLNLHVVEILNDLQLPAQLARHVLAAAVQDFIDEVRPTDPNDWLTLVRSAQRVSRERVEDYVAAAAAVDGPLVPETNDNTTRRVP